MPYMQSVANVPAIFDRIREAGTPPRFTHEFLKTNLGFASSSDRAIGKVLRGLGFLLEDGTPTARYNEFKGPGSGAVLAQGIREGWSALFMSDQRIYEKTVAEMQSVIKSVTGASDAVAKKIASTFKALCERADWSTPDASKEESSMSVNMQNGDFPSGGTNGMEGADIRLHHDIHIHLPPTSDVSVYRAIFQAMKAELM